MNLPNKLTLSRIFLSFLFVFLLFSYGLTGKVLALVVFIAASLTDVFDGFIAKTRNCVTDFGKVMDPIADKILMLSAFFAFVALDVVPAWMVIVIAFREVLITALRVRAFLRGKVISAGEEGKQKTFSQFAAVFTVLLFLVVKETHSRVGSLLTPEAERIGEAAIYLLMFVAVTLTVASGLAYLFKNREVYLNA